MSKIRIAVVVGTRPEIIKMQPIIKKIIEYRNDLELIFIHTGQHYDENMSDIFIKELKLPQPDFFLNVKSGSHGAQTARIIARSEIVLKKEMPNLVLVEGDTNSALGAALAASKLKIPIGHVEAGCRSFDKKMPEEINRILITDLTSLHFAPTETCVRNLIKEGISKEQIYLTGHPIVDLLHLVQNKINKKVLAKFGLKPKQYYLATLHREENVENKSVLKEILNTFSILAQYRPVIFPIHPRTYKSIRRFALANHLKNLIITEPVSYFDSLSLIKYARIVLTDSGGIQQEAALLETPCITLRDKTEWVETVNYNVNFLARSKDKIIKTVNEIEEGLKHIKDRFKLLRNIFGEYPVSDKIINIILKKFYSK